MTRIENNITKYGCQIEFPKICAYKIGKYFLDITKLTHKNCNKKKEFSRSKFLNFFKSKNINSNTKRFGFPITTNYPISCVQSHKGFTDYHIFINYVKNNMIDMDNINQTKKIKQYEKPEVIVDFSLDSLGEMLIKLNYNKKLSETRKKLEKNSKPYSENIIILYFDSVSRATSIRELKKTLSFFQKFMNFRNNELNKGFHSFQFLKYHAFDGYTGFNYPKIFYGENSGSHVVRITKFLKENGYMTCLANDFCYRDNCRSFHKMTKEEVYDHQMTLCDPNQEHWNHMVKRCLYGKINSEHLFEYGLQFWRKYKNNRRFLTIISNDGHEGTLKEIKYTDEVIFKFLYNLYKEYLLNKTSILLLSDHGESLPSFYYIYDFYRIEYYLPMFYIIVNDRDNSTYNEQYKFINQNQQTLISAYDIYNTILNLIYGDNYNNIGIKSNSKKCKKNPRSPLGESLFKEINQKNRTSYLFKDNSKIICHQK